MDGHSAIEALTTHPAIKSAIEAIRPDIAAGQDDGTPTADQKYGRAGTAGHGPSRPLMPRVKNAHGKYGAAR